MRKNDSKFTVEKIWELWIMYTLDTVYKFYRIQRRHIDSRKNLMNTANICSLFQK